MVFIILSWIYIAFTCFAFGLLCSLFIRRIVQAQLRLHFVFANLPHITLLLLTGLAATAVAGSVMSLFMPLAGIANLVLFALAVTILIMQRSEAGYYLNSCWRGIKYSHWLVKLLFTGFVFIAAYLSALQPSHYDYGLYYAPTIQWIEQYGVVKGLANVNTRIGFNSNWHLLQALFSFHFSAPLGMGPVNNINGFLLLAAFPYSLQGLNALLKKDYKLSTIIRSLLFLPIIAYHFGAASDYIFFNVNFISSPSADIPVCVITWLVVTWLVELDEITIGEYYRKSLGIILVTFFLFTVKPSSAPLLIASVFLFLQFVFQRKRRFAWFTMAAGLLIISPWIIRNVIISGYLLFPFDTIDVFNVDWKLPVQHVKWHANAVKSYAIDPSYDLSKPFTLSVSEWFPGWFGRLNFIQRVMFVSAIVSIITCMIIFLAQWVKIRKQFISSHKHTILAACVMIAGMLFWFLKGPDFRFGYGFIAMPVMLAFALMLRYFLKANIKYAGYVVAAALSCIMLFYYKSTWKQMPRAITTALPERRQPDSLKQVTMQNGMAMNLVFHEDSWFAPLPVANNYEFYTILPVPRGKTISEGFKASEKKSQQ